MSAGALGGDPLMAKTRTRLSAFGDSQTLLDAPPPSANKGASKHPWACIAHCGFKVLSVLAYLLLAAFVDHFVISFVTVIMLLAFDFWTVKNVTGRLLVGLRWGNDITPEGVSEWRFESLTDTSTLSSFDQRTFWIATLVMPVVWGFFAFSALVSLKLQWLLLVCVALVLSFANIVGYVRCAKDARRKLQRYAAGFVVQQAVDSAMAPQPAAAGP